ncbi:MAG TPA: hypothetical protein VKY19_10785 [Ktedonosporobacter sp.]|jgi:hypothetical protein|nr:hypothetical protein [Ktedonosporobacter sp.]
MSFTQDELQSFNAILEQRLAIHRQELEYTFDRRLRMLTHEFEQQLIATQHYLMSALPQRVLELQPERKGVAQPDSQALIKEGERQKQQVVDLVESALANHLLAIERLIQQHPEASTTDLIPAHIPENFPDLNAIEIQAEIPWNELADVIEKALDERLTPLNEAIKSSLQNMEQYLQAQLQNLQRELSHQQPSNGKADYELSLPKDQE